jgi:hypothetical protein
MNETKEYSRYIKTHIKNVKTVWKSLQPYLKKLFKFEKTIQKQIELLIASHDKSKYSEEEFLGYRQYFYSGGNKKVDKNFFNQAWNHHQKNNPHHWQYWIMWKPEGSIVLEMPLPYAIEMLCDWTAMSVQFKNSVTKWYSENKSDMFLHIQTILIIEYWLPIFEKVCKVLGEKK